MYTASLTLLLPLCLATRGRHPVLRTRIGADLGDSRRIEEDSRRIEGDARRIEEDSRRIEGDARRVEWTGRASCRIDARLDSPLRDKKQEKLTSASLGSSLAPPLPTLGSRQRSGSGRGEAAYESEYGCYQADLDQRVAELERQRRRGYAPSGGDYLAQLFSIQVQYSLSCPCGDLQVAVHSHPYIPSDGSIVEQLDSFTADKETNCKECEKPGRLETNIVRLPRYLFFSSPISDSAGVTWNGATIEPLATEADGHGWSICKVSGTFVSRVVIHNIQTRAPPSRRKTPSRGLADPSTPTQAKQAKRTPVTPTTPDEAVANFCAAQRGERSWHSVLRNLSRAAPHLVQKWGPIPLQSHPFFSMGHDVDSAKLAACVADMRAWPDPLGQSNYVPFPLGDGVRVASRKDFADVLEEEAWYGTTEIDWASRVIQRSTTAQIMPSYMISFTTSSPSVSDADYEASFATTKNNWHWHDGPTMGVANIYRHWVVCWVDPTNRIVRIFNSLSLSDAKIALVAKYFERLCSELGGVMGKWRSQIDSPIKQRDVHSCGPIALLTLEAICHHGPDFTAQQVGLTGAFTDAHARSVYLWGG